jgi:hypothetical protein
MKEEIAEIPGAKVSRRLKDRAFNDVTLLMAKVKKS